MKRELSLALGLLLAGCGGEPEASSASAEPVTQAAAEIDPALLRELLGESVRVEGEQINADGLLIRLAFDPLVRQTGSVELQLVQGQGYRLSGIPDGSPLWLLGLREGDVLTAVDQQPIIGREHALRSAYQARPSRAELTYLRGTESHTLSLRIASGSAWRSAGSRDPAILPPRRPRERPSALDNSEFAAGLRCTPGDPGLIARCEIERKALDALLRTPESLARQARIVPSVRDDRAQGFKVYGIRRSSIFSQLGFKNGDMIKAVNGRPLTSMDEALTTYQALLEETEFRVTIERKGQDTAFEITIVDALSGPPADLEGPATESPDPRDPFGGG